MNYYEHHLGDYAEATAHLSFVEDAAYSRLIRKYYASEAPLPADLKAVQRLVCARTDEEREAVETVLLEFFTLAEDGWHNARCDAEIERFQIKSNKARSSANARWGAGQSHTERNANAMPTDSERNANASKEDANASKSDAKAMLSSLQSPVSSKRQKPAQARGSRIPDDFTPDPSVALALIPDLDVEAEAAKFADFWRGKTGQGATKADWPATWRNWVRRCAESGQYSRKRAVPLHVVPTTHANMR